MISLNAHAKINISLDVLNRREDGYHNLQMIMQTVQLHDTITIYEIPYGVEIKCEAPYVPNNSANIAYKAAMTLIEKYGLDAGVRIEIDKNIPVAAGLAGGSSDAAAVLKGINELFKLNLGQAELMETGKEIGADVPYCILGGTALAEGIGERLTPLTPLGDIPIVLVKPRMGVSTAWVYKNLDLNKLNERPDTKALISAIQNGDLRRISENMGNVLESVTLAKYPVIDRLKAELVESGALGSMMSGSGPTVFGIFESRDKAEKAFNKLKHEKCDVFLTHTV